MSKELVELTVGVQRDTDILTLTEILDTRDAVQEIKPMGNCQVILASAGFALQAQDAATRAIAAATFIGTFWDELPDDKRVIVRKAVEDCLAVQQKAERVVGMAEEFAREFGMAMQMPPANPEGPLYQRLGKMQKLTQECADEGIDAVIPLTELKEEIAE